MSEVMCTSCLKLVPKIKSELRKVGRGHIYRDSSGGRWHGRKCPTCFRSDANTRYSRYFRSGTSAVKALAARKCRVCQGNLSDDRYFKHRYCDSAFKANQYAGEGGHESVWTGEEYGCGVASGTRF